MSNKCDVVFPYFNPVAPSIFQIDTSLVSGAGITLLSVKMAVKLSHRFDVAIRASGFANMLTSTKAES